MNNLLIKKYLKYIVFTFTFFVLASFQTSFWPNILSFLPSPQLWLIFIIYLIVAKPDYFNIFFIYFLGYCLTHFSEIHLKMIWLPLFVVFTAIWLVKNKIQLSGTFSFVILTLLGSFLFEFSYYGFSKLLEDSSTYLMFLNRIIQVLINFIFCYPFFFIFSSIDRFILNEDQWKKSSTQQGDLNYE